MPSIHEANHRNSIFSFPTQCSHTQVFMCQLQSGETGTWIFPDGLRHWFYVASCAKSDLPFSSSLRALQKYRPRWAWSRFCDTWILPLEEPPKSKVDRTKWALICIDWYCWYEPQFIFIHTYYSLRRIRARTHTCLCIYCSYYGHIMVASRAQRSWTTRHSSSAKLHLAMTWSQALRLWGRSRLMMWRPFSFRSWRNRGQRLQNILISEVYANIIYIQYST